MNFEKAYFLKKEIENINSEIANIEQLKGSNKKLLLKLLQEKQNEYCDELLDIIQFINQIEDRDVRIIARLRLIDNLTWEEIGQRLYMNRTSCYRKLTNYLKLHKYHT